MANPYTEQRPQEHGGTLAMLAAHPLRAELKIAFVAALAVEHGNVTKAAERAGIGRSLAQQWRAGDPEFAAAWAEAVEASTDGIESELVRRAFEEKGMPGVIALLAILKARRPAQYASPERQPVEHLDRLSSIMERAVAVMERNEVRLPDSDARQLPGPTA